VIFFVRLAMVKLDTRSQGFGTVAVEEAPVGPSGGISA
jgi:hypothetical protein